MTGADSADVMPFLENVFRGLRVTDETKQKIAARYHDFGGVSPNNGHTREFIAALQELLDAEGPALPIYWGNRNWHPMLSDTLEQMSRDGIRRAAAYVTSTFSSYSGCRKYREDLFEAVSGIENSPAVDKLRVGFNHPGFITKGCRYISKYGMHRFTSLIPLGIKVEQDRNVCFNNFSKF